MRYPEEVAPTVEQMRQRWHTQCLWFHQTQMRVFLCWQHVAGRLLAKTLRQNHSLSSFWLVFYNQGSGEFGWGISVSIIGILPELIIYVLIFDGFAVQWWL